MEKTGQCTEVKNWTSEWTDLMPNRKKPGQLLNLRGGDLFTSVDEGS